MSREQTSLYGDKAQWFRDLQERLSEQRGGTDVTNAETVTRMMEVAESSEQFP